MRYELFSKRQQRVRGEVPDVYQYEDIPQALRVQVVHIWRDVLGEIERGSWGLQGAAYEAYQDIHDALCAGIHSRICTSSDSIQHSFIGES